MKLNLIRLATIASPAIYEINYGVTTGWPSNINSFNNASATVSDKKTKFDKTSKDTLSRLGKSPYGPQKLKRKK